MTEQPDLRPLVYALPDDVEALWRPVDDDDELATIAARLDAAHVIVRGEVPDLDARVLVGALSADVVKYVVVDMVRRSMTDAADVPAGASSASFTTGPFTTNFGFDAASRDGSLYLSKQHRRLLGGGRSELYAIDLL